MTQSSQAKLGQQLNREALRGILQAENIEQITTDQLVELFRQETDLAKFAPDGICQVDPRTETYVIYNSARSRRPHDNQPRQRDPKNDDTSCMICQGETTGVVDVADLSEGFTFINKNLFRHFVSVPEK